MDHRKPRTDFPSAAKSPAKPESYTNQPASLLLDRYEIERITGDLERFLLRSAKADTAAKHGRGASGGGALGGRAAAKMKGLRRFMALQAVAFCGSDADSAVVSHGGRGVVGWERAERPSAAGRRMVYM